MTCIVGLVDNGTVYIGGDSAGVNTDNLSMSVRADRKVFRNGPFIMGFTSSFRMGQLLAHALKPPKRRPGEDVYKYMVTRWIDAVRKCLTAGGSVEFENGAEKGGTFLVGYEGRLFLVDEDYQIGEAADGFDACGSGGELARGSLFSSGGAEPQDRILLALAGAERMNAGVRAPFYTISSREKQPRLVS